MSAGNDEGHKVMATRYFAYCDTKGCREARPFLTFERNGVPMIRTAESGLVSLIDAAVFRPAGAVAAMTRRGIVCPSHGPMRVEGIKATHNPDKVCDGRCTHAKRASCDCSCGGANHGSSF